MINKLIYLDNWQHITYRNGEITASSVWSDSHLPQLVNFADGLPWHDGGSGENQWLEFTFATPVTINGFRTKAHSSWDGSAFKDYEFQVYANSWITIKSGVGENQDCCEWQVILFNETTSHRFRLFMKNNWGYGYLTIQELQLSFLNGIVLFIMYDILFLVPASINLFCIISRYGGF